MIQENYFIKANVFGKIRYWSFIEGLHSGRKKTAGFSIYNSKIEVYKEIKKLKKVYHSGIKFEELPDSELPFIKKQIKERNKKNNIKIRKGWKLIT